MASDLWPALCRRAINCAAGLTNFVEECGSTRKAERELQQIEIEANALRALEELPAKPAGVIADLLNALEMAKPLLELEGYSDASPAMQVINHAIAKAAGAAS